MNIGLFTETYYPEINGVAASVYVLKEELEKMGHNVYVFTTTSPGTPENERNVFRVHSLPCILIADRRVGLFYQRRIALRIKKLNLDLIHTHTEFSLGIFGRIMARELKIPVVHTYHTIYEDYTHYVTKGLVLDSHVKKVARAFSKVCCNNVSAVIVPTEKVKKLLENYHVNRQIKVIPTGINLQKFSFSETGISELDQIRRQYGIEKNDKVIIYVGRISYEKNIDELFEYLPEFLREHKDCKFVMVGNGPDFKHFERKVKELHTDSFILMGEKPYDDIQKYYHIGDVFVCASNSETQGLTFLEAMAAGIPVVAKLDECLEGILDQGRNGFFFSGKEDFKNALEEILYSGRIEDFQDEARNTAYNYSTEIYARSVLDTYEVVLERNEELASIHEKG